MTLELNPLSDQDLLRNAGDGDVEAFGALYERFLDPIYRYIFYRISSVEEAEDLTETIFLKAWENIRNRESAGEIENVRAWLYRIAHNQVIDYHRKKRPVSVDMDAHLQSNSEDRPSTEETVQAHIVQKGIQEAISALDEQAREIISLRFFNGLSHAEVAAVLDLKEGHVRVLQYRALKQLKKLLGEESHERTKNIRSVG